MRYRMWLCAYGSWTWRVALSAVCCHADTDCREIIVELSELDQKEERASE